MWEGFGFGFDSIWNLKNLTRFVKIEVCLFSFLFFFLSFSYPRLLPPAQPQSLFSSYTTYITRACTCIYACMHTRYRNGRAWGYSVWSTWDMNWPCLARPPLACACAYCKCILSGGTPYGGRADCNIRISSQPVSCRLSTINNAQVCVLG